MPNQKEEVAPLSLDELLLHVSDRTNTPKLKLDDAELDIPITEQSLRGALSFVEKPSDDISIPELQFEMAVWDYDNQLWRDSHAIILRLFFLLVPFYHQLNELFAIQMLHLLLIQGALTLLVFVRDPDIDETNVIVDALIPNFGIRAWKKRRVLKKRIQTLGLDKCVDYSFKETVKLTNELYRGRWGDMVKMERYHFLRKKH